MSGLAPAELLLAAGEAVYLAALALVAGAWTLWPAALAARAARRRPPAAPPLTDDDLPAVAVLVPVRDEGAWIDARLDDLARTDYPRERLRVLVLDGGSRDDTAARVRARAARDASVRLVALPRARSKSEQLAEGLACVREEIAIVTDADVRLAPDAVRRLVEALVADPRAGAIGAWSEPATALAEERLHWMLVNRLWRLEGDALGASLFSGVCYALRVKATEAPAPDAVAEDAHLALALAARGWRVGLLRAARAFELRVPSSARELVAYRRRRGAALLRELHRPASAETVLRARVARAGRRWQLAWAPRAALVAAALAPLLLAASPRRGALALAALGAFAPLALALFAAALATVGPRRPARAAVAVLRLAAFEITALAALLRRPVDREGAR